MKKLMLTLFFLVVSSQASALCLPIACTCSVAVTPVSFGSFNPLLSGTHDANGNVAMNCGGVVGLAIPYTIKLSQGNGTSYTARRMASGSNYLSYNLYTDNYVTIWGDGTGGSTTTGGTVVLDVLGLSPPRNHTLYGRVASNQKTAVPGFYTDTITVTVTYF
ncbi:spore coat U domain-containing protein [Herminiimonas aquatilis]|uniref:Spore coat U domain-containing protein n=1 Tax=Herminiimonas aquatilis TaxID=345342 RepID=A0ABW2J1X3_9BURK